MVAAPFRSPLGAQSYLWFVYGRVVVFILGPISLIVSSFVPSRRAVFGGVFLSLFVTLMGASVIAILLSLVKARPGTILERISAPFSPKFVGEAAEILGLDLGVARSRALIGSAGSLVAIGFTAAVVVILLL